MKLMFSLAQPCAPVAGGVAAGGGWSESLLTHLPVPVLSLSQGPN